MRIVETNEPFTIRIMQRERVAQTVWPFRRGVGARNLEFQPVSLIEIVDAAIEREQKCEGMLILTCHIRI